MSTPWEAIQKWRADAMDSALVRSLRGLAREIAREQVQLVDLLGKTGPITADDLVILRDHFVHIYQASLEAMRQIDDPTLVEEKTR